MYIATMLHVTQHLCTYTLRMQCNPQCDLIPCIDLNLSGFDHSKLLQQVHCS